MNLRDFIYNKIIIF